MLVLARSLHASCPLHCNRADACSELRRLFAIAGALAGNPFGVDRQWLAQELGCVGGVCPNSMDAV
jgi:argininosuccinate lyase